MIDHLRYFLLFSLITTAEARIVSMGGDNTSGDDYEIPRSQIKTYIQRGSIEENLRTVKTIKPSSFSDEEVLSIPEKYLTPELKIRKKEILTTNKENLFKNKSPKALAKKIVISNKVKIKGSQNKLIDIKIENTVWVPSKSGSSQRAKTILAPEQRLAQATLIESVTTVASKEIRKEVLPGEPEEIKILFENGKSVDTQKAPLNHAVTDYLKADYASATTRALDLIDKKSTPTKTKEYARYLLAHSLYQAGFYSSSLTHLVMLSQSSLRRSVIGMSAYAIEKTRDDSAANQILSKVSLSQIPENHQSLFSFHFGRILLNTGALDAALSAFSRVGAESSRYPEAQYYMGVIRASSLSSAEAEKNWDDNKSQAGLARLNFEETILYSRAKEAGDLKNLAHLALARLGYQAKQFNQSTFHYQSVEASSIFARDALYETAWALYRLGEYNRSLGGLHSLGSSYYESRDLTELWILRSLNYLKLCRFDEANRAANTFEQLSKTIKPDVVNFSKQISSKNITKLSQIQSLNASEWISRVLNSDPVFKKDQHRENLLEREKQRINAIRNNKNILDAELKNAVADALEQNLNLKIERIAQSVKPYVIDRFKTIETDYQAQQTRLDMLRFEIYNQATKFPAAMDRPEAKKLLAKKEFLPGVFLKGHEILWKYNGESWIDEIKGYDYFIPTECLKNTSGS